MLAEFIGVEDRLRQALQAGQLTGKQEARGEALLSRLVSPVRVAVLGQRRSGKTGVFNVLAGSVVLPADLRLPTAQLMWGLPPETVLTYPDRSTRTFGLPTAQELTEGAPIFVSLKRDLPALRRIALLEVVMEGEVDKQARALDWAAARCDLVVWCTRTMDEIELHLMSKLPGALRKHAIVALTHADRLGGPEAVAARLDEIGALTGEETQLARAIDTRTALMGLSQGGPSVSETLRASGAEALADAVQEKVDAGYARVREAAEKLLEDAVLSAARAVAVQPAPVAPAPEAAPIPQAPAAAAPEAEGVAEQGRLFRHGPPRDAPRHSPTAHHSPVTAPAKLAVPTPAFRPAFASAPASAPGPHPGAAPVPEPVHDPVPEPAHAPVAQRPSEPANQPVEDRVSERLAAPQPEPAKAPGDAAPILTPEGRETVAGAIRYLTERGAGWARTARTNPAAASAQIMSDILGDAEWLSSYLGEPFGADEPLIAPARRMAEDILDLVQLMEMEHTDRATSDAVCLMLQAQRRLQAIAVAA